MYKCMSETWLTCGSKIAFVILENFQEAMVLILPGNVARSLKLELLSCIKNWALNTFI